MSRSTAVLGLLLLSCATRGEELKNQKNQPQIISSRPGIDQFVLEPQTQYPTYNGFIPGVSHQQPQILIYTNPGQHFLYGSGAPPPGNFLIPQQPQPGGPGIFFGADNPAQGVPAYPGSYPGSYPGIGGGKPAFVPPIEKDAEEIPAEIARNHPVANPNPYGQQVQKSLRLETFDEEPESSTNEADDLERPAKNPKPTVLGKKPLPPLPNNIPSNVPALKPGHQFFILNGQDLFQNFPFQTPGVPGRQPFLQPGLYQPNPQIYLYHQGAQGQYQAPPPPPPHVPQFDQHVPVQGLFQRNAVTGQISNVKLDGSPENLLAPFGQVPDFRQSFSAFPYAYRADLQQPNILAAEEDDSVVIDAKVASTEDKTSEKPQSDAVSSVKAEEPSLSQAEPSAIALAGIGGVASAAPKGTALTGNRGLAVAAPKATAVAGPKKEGKDKDKESQKKEK